MFPNTKTTGIIGVIMFVCALLMYGPFQTQVLAMLGPITTHYAQLILLIAGFVAAYYGMPHTVPTANESMFPNTKTTGIIGVIMFVCALLMYGPFQTQVLAMLGPITTHYAQLIFLIAGFVAAYYGMPHTVPTAKDA